MQMFLRETLLKPTEGNFFFKLKWKKSVGLTDVNN